MVYKLGALAVLIAGALFLFGAYTPLRNAAVYPIAYDRNEINTLCSTIPNPNIDVGGFVCIVLLPKTIASGTLGRLQVIDHGQASSYKGDGTDQNWVLTLGDGYQIVRDTEIWHYGVTRGISRQLEVIWYSVKDGFPLGNSGAWILNGAFFLGTLFIVVIAAVITWRLDPNRKQIKAPKPRRF